MTLFGRGSTLTGRSIHAIAPDEPQVYSYPPAVYRALCGVKVLMDDGVFDPRHYTQRRQACGNCIRLTGGNA